MVKHVSIQGDFELSFQKHQYMVNNSSFSRVKVPNPPGSGKDIAEGKGVHREMESERR